jgi:hypothetical protein
MSVEELERGIVAIEARLAAMGPPKHLDFHGRLLRGSYINERNRLYDDLARAEDAAHGPEEERKP